MQELLFHDATVITMDRERAILEHASVAARGDRIVDVGPAAELRHRYPAAKVIDCRRKVVLPGMVDLHGYLGGSLLKSAGQNLSGAARRAMLENLLPDYTDEQWWEADAQLNALDRATLFRDDQFIGRNTNLRRRAVRDQQSCCSVRRGLDSVWSDPM